MLLYDHLMNWCHQRIRKGHMDKYDMARWAYLRAAKVYEITSVVPLFSDWLREKVKKVPRKPPVLPLWAEWEHTFLDGDGIAWDWTIGAVLYEWPYSLEQMTISTSRSGSRTIEQVMEVVRGADELYGTQLFRKLRKVPALPEEELRKPHVRRNFQIGLNHVFTDRDSCLWALKDNGTVFDGFLVSDQPDHAAQLRLNPAEPDPNAVGMFGLPVLTDAASNPSSDPFFIPWPMFMAFALLHCKNVGTDEHAPDERAQRGARRAGHPPRVTYKTLHVTVPQTRKVRGAAAGESCQRMRFHLCSGHLKNLTAACYKEPGYYWWNAHWRGDPELGTVITDTKLRIK